MLCDVCSDVPSLYFVVVRSRRRGTAGKKTSSHREACLLSEPASGQVSLGSESPDGTWQTEELGASKVWRMQPSGLAVATQRTAGVELMTAHQRIPYPYELP